MSKTNKELAVEVICTWLNCVATIDAGKNVNLPNVEQLSEAIAVIHEKLSKLSD